MSERTIEHMDPSAVLLLADGTRRRLVDGFQIVTDIERVFSDRATVPDESWVYTDVNGHEHTYVRDEDGVPRLPTLDRRTKHIDCACGASTGDECEGCDVDEWFCRECGAIVEPGFKPDLQARDVGTPVTQVDHYSLTADFPMPKGKRSWRHPKTRTITIRATDPPLVGPFEGAQLAWIDQDGKTNTLPLPTLVDGGTEFVMEDGKTVLRARLRGEEMKMVKRKPTGP